MIYLAWGTSLTVEFRSPKPKVGGQHSRPLPFLGGSPSRLRLVAATHAS